MIDYDLILNKRFNKLEWTLINNDYSKLIWLSDTKKPTQKQLDDLWSEVQAEIAAEAKAKELAKSALLAKLGINEDELELLLG
jgi:hypothetical protein